MPKYAKYRRTYPKKKWSFNTGQAYVSLEGCGIERWSSTGTNIIRIPSRIQDQAGPLLTPFSGNTVKDIECHFSISGTTYDDVYLTFAIMYIPERVTTDYENKELGTLDDDCLFYTHPEWVLGFRTVQFNAPNQVNEWVVRSRIKKKMSGGDTIAAFCLVVNHANDASQTFTNHLMYCNYSYKIAY